MIGKLVAAALVALVAAPAVTLYQYGLLDRQGAMTILRGADADTHLFETVRGIRVVPLLPTGLL